MRHLGVLGVMGLAAVIVIGHHERSGSRDEGKQAAVRDELIRAEQAMRDRPPTISELTVDGITYRRAGAFAPAVESLSTALLAIGRPSHIDAEPFVARHCLSYVWAPSIGSSFRRDFEIGENDVNGCAAKQDGELVRLPRAICEDVAAVSAGFTPGVTTCASAELRALMRRAR